MPAMVASAWLVHQFFPRGARQQKYPSDIDFQPHSRAPVKELIPVWAVAVILITELISQRTWPRNLPSTYSLLPSVVASEM